jgi:hypothetical protein
MLSDDGPVEIVRNRKPSPTTHRNQCVGIHCGERFNRLRDAGTRRFGHDRGACFAEDSTRIGCRGQQAGLSARGGFKNGEGQALGPRRVHKDVSGSHHVREPLTEQRSKKNDRGFDLELARHLFDAAATRLPVRPNQDEGRITRARVGKPLNQKVESFRNWVEPSHEHEYSASHQVWCRLEQRCRFRGLWQGVKGDAIRQLDNRRASSIHPYVIGLEWCQCMDERRSVEIPPLADPSERGLAKPVPSSGKRR